MRILEYFSNKSLEDKLLVREKRLCNKLKKSVDKGRITRAEKLAVEYNDLIDKIWDLGPSKYPLHKLITDFSEGPKFEGGSKCHFRGCDNGEVELMPHFFGTVMVAYVCKSEECRKAFSDYMERRGFILNSFYKNVDKLVEQQKK